MRIYLVFFILFTCADFNKQNGFVKRVPTSQAEVECSKVLKSFFEVSRSENLSKSAQNQINSTLSKLSKMTLKSKLEFLNILNARRGKYKFLSQMYANTINQMISKGYLDIKDVPALLKGGDKSHYYLDFTYGEVRLIPRAWDNLPTLDQTIDIIILRSQATSDDIIRLRQLLTDQDFNPVQLNEFQKYFTKFPQTDEEWYLLTEYMSFSSALREKKQLEAMSELPKLFYEHDKGKHVNKFRSIRKNIQAYEKKQYDNELKKARKAGESPEEAEEIAKSQARQLTQAYSGLKYACRSTKPTAESRAAIRSTKNLFLGLGLTATVSTYTYANWEEDKTKFDWYGKLGHDIAWKIFFQYGYNMIMTDQAATLMKKAIALHLFYTPMDAVESALYEFEFGEENTFLQEEYDRILALKKSNDPLFVDAYNDAMTSLNHAYFPEKFKRYAYGLINGDIKHPDDEFDKILSLNDISVGELEDEVLREKLMEAIALNVYNENSGMVKSGSGFLDRYLFVRSYDVLDVPPNLLVGLWIYRTICMGGSNIKAALAKATLIYTVNAVVGKFIYYEMRKKLINM